MLAVVFLAAGFPSAADALDTGPTGNGDFQMLPQTGQTACYGTNGNLLPSCSPTPGQDGDLLRGKVWPDPRFTNPDGSTPVSGTIVLDKLTGLEWPVDGSAPAVAGTPSCAGGPKTWQTALDYVNCLNTNNYLGFNDWRLPNITELNSLVNKGQDDSPSWLNSSGYSSVQNGEYWSATTHAGVISKAWFVNMGNGWVSFDSKLNSRNVWPVRGPNGSSDNFVISLPQTGQSFCYSASATASCDNTGQDGEFHKGMSWPTPRFTADVGGTGTTTDNLTGLIWVKDGSTPDFTGATSACTGGWKTWQEAFEYVNCLNTNNYLGHNDWRLPNSAELYSLVDKGQSNSASWLNVSGFSSVQLLWYWSSTTHAGNPVDAWFVNMVWGDMGTWNKASNYQFYVWPVRGGQFGASGNHGILINWGAAATNHVNVMLDLDASDPSGVSEMQFRNEDSGAWTTPEPYSRLKSWTLDSVVGTKTVFVKLKDALGNWSQEYSDTITLDTTPPQIVNASSITSDGYYKEGGLINITLNFSEPITSAGGLVIALNSGGTVNTGPLYNVSSFSGVYAVAVGQTSAALSIASITGTIIDSALNPTVNPLVPAGQNIGDSKSIVIDTTVPVVSAGPDQMKNAQFTQTATATDASPMEYSWTEQSGPDALIFGSPLELSTTITAAASGTYIIRFTATDAAGNSSFSEMKLVRDLVAPTGNSVFQMLPRTGQTACYDTLGNPLSSCANTGQDGDHQRGKAWPNPRFSNPDGSTPASGTIVLDKLTGLQWPVDAGTPTFTGATSTCTGGGKTWQAAFVYVNCLNANNYLGHNDWRLPNINELYSLINKGQSSNASWLTTSGFTSVNPYYYWSSTTAAGSSGSGWGLISLDGGGVGSGSKADGVSVWPVRGPFGSSEAFVISLPQTGQTLCYDASGIVSCTDTGQDGEFQKGLPWPNPRFSTEINGTGTVTDNLTGLIWMQDGSTPAITGAISTCTGGGKTWQAALDYVKCLNMNNYLGFHDWRLPNIIELYSIAGKGQANPSAWLNTNGFLSMQNWYYWSATTSAGGTDHAMFVEMSNGGVGGYVKDTGFAVWPVRGGHFGALGNMGILINWGAVATGSTVVTLALDASDSSGVSQMQFKNEVSGTWSDPEPYSRLKSWTLDAGDGTKTVFVKFKDTAGNWTEQDYSDSIILLSTPPVATIAGTPPVFTNTTGATLTVGGANVVSYKYKIDNGVYSADTPIATPITLSGLADGSHTVSVIGKGAAFNWQPEAGAATATWTVDTTPPTTAPSLPEGGYRTPQSVSLICNDSTGSGCNNINYSFDGTGFFVYTSPIDIPADSYLTVYSVDNVGNPETPKTYYYSIDPLSPSVSILSPSLNAETDDVLFISGTASDSSPSAGLDRVEIQVAVPVTGGIKYLNSLNNWALNNPQWIRVVGTDNWTWDTLDPTVTWTPGKWYTITARVFDKAGNISTTTSKFYFFSGTPAYTTLSLTLSAGSILNNGAVSLAGKLTRLPDIGTDLNNLPITFSITDPDVSSVQSISVNTRDKYGHYLLENVGDSQSPVKFTKKGTYTIVAEFAGNEIFSYAQSPVNSLLVGSAAGYAIIIEGKATGNEGLPSHNKTANRVYDRLRSRGFTDDNIYYFNYAYTPGHPTIDAQPSKAAIQAALQGIAPFNLLSKMNNVPAPLYIIMVDHGTNGNFIINNETITPAELNTWLKTLEAGLDADALAEKRIIINGSCYSGSFIPELKLGRTSTDAGRIVITSAASNEESYMGPNEPDNIRSGEFFIEEFFKELAEGSSVKAAFEGATGKTESYTRKGSGAAQPPYNDDAAQHPLLDDSGAGIGSNQLSDFGGDGAEAASQYLGAGVTNAVTNPAEFTKVTDTQSLTTAESTYIFWGEVGDNAEVDWAWIEVRSPSTVLASTGGSLQLDLDIPKVFMAYNSASNRWEAAYSSFMESGMYEVFYFTSRKGTEEISTMKKSTVYKDRTGNSPPGTFNLLLPANNAVQRTVLLFDWTDSIDPNSDPVTYTLQVLATDQSSTCMQTVVYQKEGLSYSITSVGLEANLQDLTTYCWKVIAVDKYGRTRPSTQTWKFLTNNTNGLPGFITGKVMNSLSLAGLAGAIVNITVGTSTNSIATLPDGNYLWAVPPGAITIAATAPNYDPSANTDLFMNPGDTMTYNILLVPQDTTPPNPPVVSGTTATSSATPTWSWSSGGNGGSGNYRYQLDSEQGVWTDTTSLSFIPSPLPDGSHTLNVRERDAVGNWSASGSKTIQTDTTLPADGSLTATGGDAVVAVNWSGFSDGGSGLSPSNTYKLVRDAGVSPNSQCTTGSTVYQGTGLSTSDNNVVNGITYYYRLCAADTTGNVSLGATATATPQSPAINPLLTVTKTGLGSGTVTGTGINCGSSCSQNYAPNAQVILTAAADTGSTFSGWSGIGINCPGIGSCTVVMGAANTTTTVIATFSVAPPPAPIGLSVTPSAWTDINSFTMNWTNPYDPTGITGAYYKIGAPPVSETDGTFTTLKPIINVNATSQGTSTIYVWLKDGANNSGYQNCATGTLRYDATIPVDGTATATQIACQVSINWSGYSDPGGSGIAGYEVVKDTVVLPAPYCASGTLLYSGSGASVTDYLPATGDNHYRICAIDNAGNVSGGHLLSVSHTSPAGNPPAQYSDHSATFTSSAPIQEAYDSQNAAGKTIRTVACRYGGTLLFDSNIAIGLEGGYNDQFSASSGITVLSGSLTISGGTVTISNIAIE